MVERPTPRKRRAEERRVHLITTALDLFAERGFENVSISELAARAGVAHGLVYHYFASKDELLLAVLEQASPAAAFRALGEQMHGMPVDEGIRLFARNLGAMLDERKPVMRLLLREALSPRSVLPAGFVDMQEHVLWHLGRYLEERSAAGEVAPLDPRVPFRMLISSTLILALLDQPVAPWADAFAATILHGIHAGTPSDDDGRTQT